MTSEITSGQHYVKEVHLIHAFCHFWNGVLCTRSELFPLRHIRLHKQRCILLDQLPRMGSLTIMPLRIVLRSFQKARACILPSLDPTAKISTGARSLVGFATAIPLISTHPFDPSLYPSRPPILSTTIFLYFYTQQHSRAA
jgi:hypothetical protein